MAPFAHQVANVRIRSSFSSQVGAMCACARSLARFVALPYSFTRVALPESAGLHLRVASG